MCAILDASALDHVFGGGRPPAGVAFLEWVTGGPGRIVLGGKLDRELRENERFRDWIRGAYLAGKARHVEKREVERIAKRLRIGRSCLSNDPHVIALAQLTGARLLYSNDRKLNRDFLNPRLVPAPRGQVYTTLDDREFTADHRTLLEGAITCP